MKLSIGDKVVVQNTLMYNGQTGTLTTASNDPEDIWDFNVILDRPDRRRIGVTRDQVVKQ